MVYNKSIIFLVAKLRKRCMLEASLNQCEEIDKWISQLPGQVGAIALRCLYTDSQRSSKGLSPSHP